MAAIAIKPSRSRVLILAVQDVRLSGCVEMCVSALVWLVFQNSYAANETIVYFFCSKTSAVGALCQHSVCHVQRHLWIKFTTPTLYCSSRLRVQVQVTILRWNLRVLFLVGRRYHSSQTHQLYEVVFTIPWITMSTLRDRAITVLIGIDFLCSAMVWH